ncbi:MAG: ornithine cyclodeaminase family protein [Bacteroidota bacterium]
MFLVPEADVQNILAFPDLISALRVAFQENYVVPMRHHHDFDNPSASKASTLLLMPAWQEGEFLGVKIVTVSPDNHLLKMPAIHGTYLLFNAANGQPILQTDARRLTSKRTAAASALAADYLAKSNSKSLLMVGTGALAPQLIEAHAQVRPLEKVFVWGRNPAKAQLVIDQLTSMDQLSFEVVTDLEVIVPEVDIISMATLSPEPLIKGEWLKPGQHVDLVGSYKPNMREADDRVIQKAKIYVDTLEGAPKESGDLAIPLKNGLIQLSDIQGDLFDLCRGKIPGRQSTAEITLFKSVGHALEDLAAAKLLYQHLVDDI